MMDEQGKFEFIKELGRGSFGSVVLARNTKTGEQVRLLQAYHCFQLEVCGQVCGVITVMLCKINNACLLPAERLVQPLS
jgi:serine/threonine protein kinase